MSSATTSAIIIPCPHCDSLNRMPEARRGQKGKCGHCHQPLFTGKPIALNKKRFGVHAGANDLPLLVDFWAAWCGPCLMMAPIFEAAAAEFEPRVRFAKVDSDAEAEISDRYQIRSIPTLVLIKGGREIARQSGVVPATTLRQWINQHVS
jgi:thioredoxin 2